MRLLYCSRDYTTHDLRFVRAFVDHGIEVVYARLEDDGVPYVLAPLPSGASWADWSGPRRAAAPPSQVKDMTGAFAELVRQTRPDLVHAGPVQTFGTMAALANARPTVLVSWGYDLLVDASRDDWYQQATRMALEHAAALVVDNAAVLAAARHYASALPAHLCIPWGPEVVPSAGSRGWRSTTRQRHGWEEAVVVIATRAWQPGYRTPELVDVFAEAARECSALRLVLAGAGPEADRVTKRIQRHDIADLVLTPGVLDHDALARYLAAADIYLSLVPSDGTSISLMEAMAHGLAVVAANSPGNREWLESGVSGRLIDGDDLDGFSLALVKFAQSPAERAVCGARARTVAETKADWSHNASRLVRFYREIASGRGLG